MDKDKVEEERVIHRQETPAINASSEGQNQKSGSPSAEPLDASCGGSEEKASFLLRPDADDDRNDEPLPPAYVASMNEAPDAENKKSAAKPYVPELILDNNCPNPNYKEVGADDLPMATKLAQDKQTNAPTTTNITNSTPQADHVLTNASAFTGNAARSNAPANDNSSPSPPRPVPTSNPVEILRPQINALSVERSTPTATVTTMSSNPLFMAQATLVEEPVLAQQATPVNDVNDRPWWKQKSIIFLIILIFAVLSVALAVVATLLVTGNGGSLPTNPPAMMLPTEMPSAMPSNNKANITPSLPPSQIPSALPPVQPSTESFSSFPSSTPSESSFLSVMQTYSQLLLLEDGQETVFDEVQLGTYQQLMEGYTSEFGFNVSAPEIVSTCTVTNQILITSRALMGQDQSHQQRIPRNYRENHSENLNSHLRKIRRRRSQQNTGEEKSLSLSFTMLFETRYGYDISSYPSLFQEYLNTNMEKMTNDMQSKFLPISQARQIFILLPAPTASMLSSQLPSTSPSVQSFIQSPPPLPPVSAIPETAPQIMREMYYQSISLTGGQRFLDEDELGIYQLLMEGYTSEFGFNVSSPEIVSTCTVTEQNMARMRTLTDVTSNYRESHSQTNSTSLEIFRRSELSLNTRQEKSLQISFTMQFRTTYGYDIFSYPSLFRNYINSNKERVMEDMQSLFIPVFEISNVQFSRPTSNPTEVPTISPSSSPSEQDAIFALGMYRQQLTVDGPYLFNVDQIAIYESMLESYTEAIGLNLATPLITTKCTITEQSLSEARKNYRRMAIPHEYKKKVSDQPCELVDLSISGLNRGLQGEFNLLIDFTVGYESRYGHDITNYPDLFVEFINENKLSLLETLETMGFGVISVGDTLLYQ